MVWDTKYGVNHIILMLTWYSFTLSHSLIRIMWVTHKVISLTHYEVSQTLYISYYLDPTISTQMGSCFCQRNLMKFIPANIYLFKVSSTNIRKRCEICSKLTIKTSEWRWWRGSDVFKDNFEYTSHLFLVFLFMSLNK